MHRPCDSGDAAAGAEAETEAGRIGSPQVRVSRLRGDVSDTSG